MTYEIIIAADAVRAESYAITQGWKSKGSGRAAYERPTDADPVDVRFVATPMALAEIPTGTHVHVGPFPGGMPAAWAHALARHSVVTDISDKRIGGYKPMASAPKDRSILIFCAERMAWRTAAWEKVYGVEGWATAVRGTQFEDECEWVNYPACWIELPEDPPEIMIKAALPQAIAS